MDKLIDYLEQIPKGKIADKAQLEKLLAESWDEFEVENGGMKAYKLLGRMEYVSWNPPILQFSIERHGGTALGSTRSELQHWELNTEQKVITKSRYSNYRQIKARVPSLDVKPIAEEITRLILNRLTDDRLRWSKAGHVQVKISKILPKYSAVKQTLEGRRTRLSGAIHRKLIEHGWTRLPNNWYSPPNVHHQREADR